MTAGHTELSVTGPLEHLDTWSADPVRSCLTKLEKMLLKDHFEKGQNPWEKNEPNQEYQNLEFSVWNDKEDDDIPCTDDGVEHVGHNVHKDQKCVTSPSITCLYLWDHI